MNQRMCACVEQKPNNSRPRSIQRNLIFQAQQGAENYTLLLLLSLSVKRLTSLLSVVAQAACSAIMPDPGFIDVQLWYGCWCTSDRSNVLLCPARYPNTMDVTANDPTKEVRYPSRYICFCLSVMLVLLSIVSFRGRDIDLLASL